MEIITTWNNLNVSVDTMKIKIHWLITWEEEFGTWVLSSFIKEINKELEKKEKIEFLNWWTVRMKLSVVLDLSVHILKKIYDKILLNEIVFNKS